MQVSDNLNRFDMWDRKERVFFKRDLLHRKISEIHKVTKLFP